MSGPTPGPWEVRGKPQTGPYRDGFYIAARNISPAIAHVKTESDAVLIAAAPEMLEALKLALVSLDTDGSASAAAVLYTHGRAAIAKATGEKP